MSHPTSVSILTLGCVFALIGSSALFASGGQKAYSNPTGDPAEDTYLEPYTNGGVGGRMLVYCADDEKLVVTPVDGAGVEVTCEAAQ